MCLTKNIELFNENNYLWNKTCSLDLEQKEVEKSSFYIK